VAKQAKKQLTGISIALVTNSARDQEPEGTDVGKGTGDLGIPKRHTPPTNGS
jgi:hypothetical protein